MTKEELEKEAEEWVNKNKPVQDDWEDSDIIQAIIDTSEPREKRIADLEKENTGLKAGRPEWHKPDDLPKDNRLVLIHMVNGNTTMGIYYVNAWREICNCKKLTGVIAWCEIPKYTEEIEK